MKRSHHVSPIVMCLSSLCFFLLHDLLIPMFLSFPCLSHGCFETWGPQLNSLTSANPYLDPPNPILGPGRFPCLSHSNVSLMPMSLSCLCLSHSYVSPISLSLLFPCLSHSYVSLNPGAIPVSFPFSCLSHAYVSLMPMSLTFLCLSHSPVYLIPLSLLFPRLSHSYVSLNPGAIPVSFPFSCLSHAYVSRIPMSLPFPCLSHSPVSLIPPSLSFLCLSPSFASSILMSHFHVFPIPMSVLNNPPSLAIFHHGLMDDIPPSLCFPEPLG